MITRSDKIIFVLIILLAIGAVFFLKNRKTASAASQGSEQRKEGKGDKKKKGKKEDGGANDPRISIGDKWEMPSELKEISGISWMGDRRFACVQDEDGKIFIYNADGAKIERTIDFGGPGDYEGIAVAGTTAYVMRADGLLFEVQSFTGTKPTVLQHRTHLTVKQDVEGLCYDEKGNRLLLAIKGDEADTKDYKGIYAFPLASKKLAAAPVFRIDARGSGGKKGKVQPSDLDVHPATGEIYIIDGPAARLIVLSPDGSPKDSYQLSESDFPQAEGLVFNSGGELFISNEGKSGAGNILQVKLGVAQ